VQLHVQPRHARRLPLALLSLWLPVPLSVALTACVGMESPPAVDEIAVNADCPNFGCGSNSPVVGWPPFHELDEGPPADSSRARRGARRGGDGELDQGGQFNHEGLRVVHIRKGLAYYRLDVEGDELRALDENGDEALVKDELETAIIVLERYDGTRFDVFIEEHSDSLAFWVGPGDESIDSYRMTWVNSDEPGPREPMCQLPVDIDEWGPVSHEAIFFQGDRYDAITKEVIATGGDTRGWFNVACAGSAVAKVHLERHTRAGASGRWTVGVREEQALLRMYVADYCGTGTAFTEIKEPLRWQNRTDWHLLGLADPIDHEAVWDWTGALCLDNPRMGDSEEEVEETMSAIASVCDPPPPCTGEGMSLANWKDRGYLLTANP
jgi:ADYC domain